MSTSLLLDVQAVLAGRYHVERELGRGGMGVVWLARDVALDRPVAIKAFLPELAGQQDLRERFLREARTAASLSHPNVVPIHIVEERGQVVLFVMGWVDGETLGARIDRVGRLTGSAVARVVQEVAWALAYAHRLGIVHRDIKPENIMLERDSGRAMVMDFGIARAMERTAGTAGELVGTAHYMSPEQATGEPVDGRSDIYSLGVTAFQALAGRVPFDGPSVTTVLMKQVTEAAPPIATIRPEIPPALARAVDRCLAKDPAARFSSGEELAVAIAPSAAGPPAAPPQIRILMRLMNSVAASGGLTMAGFYVLSEAPGLRADVTATLLALMFGPLALLIGRLLQFTRRSIRDGFGFRDLENALIHEARAHREELYLEGTEKANRYMARHDARSVRATPWVLMVSGAAILAAGIAGGERNFASLAFGPLFFLLGVGRRLAESPDGFPEIRALQLQGRLLAGPFGRFLFRVAGVGLSERQSPQLAMRTEVALAGAVDELFAALPEDVRRRHAGIPSVIKRLQGDAELLRRRRERVEQALTQVGGAGGSDVQVELERSRQLASERLSAVITALETLRLNLLRLGAGISDAESITDDLARALELSRAVSAELAGVDQVRQLLARDD